jgi:DUF4097 and DUF4098 domain-containing protein YvlB
MATKTKVHRRQFEKEVRLGLDPNDQEPLIREAAQADRDYNELKAEAANVAATYRQKIKDVDEKRSEALLTLSQGKPVMRMVEEVRNFTKETVTIIDVETKKVLERRAMNDDDAQVPIPDHPNGEEGPDEEDTED